MKSIFLDSYQLHSNTLDLPHWVSPNIQGLGAPDIRLDSYNKPGADGYITANAFLGARLITLEGTVAADSVDPYLAARSSLARLAVPAKNSIGQLQPRKLSFTDMNDEQFFIYCVVTNYENPDGLPLSSEWQMQLQATDHRIYLADLHEAIITLAISGGYSIPYSFPYSFGDSSGGSFNIINAGTISTPPIIEFHGPVQDPRIMNMSTSQTMALNLSLLAGDVVTIDMADFTIIQGSSTNRMGAKTPDSRFWDLVPGDNLFTFTAATYDTGFARILWRDAQSGR